MLKPIHRTLLLALIAAFAMPAFCANDPSIDELKERLKSTNVNERPRLCLHIAERQLDAATKSFSVDESDKARASLIDVIAFSELARDYAVQSGKHQKQSEIAVRGMTRRLSDLKHSVPHDDQPAIQDAIDRLQRVRDDLLLSMFPHGKKG